MCIELLNVLQLQNKMSSYAQISKIITGDSLLLRSKILVDLEEQNTLILWIKIRRRYVCARFFCSFFGSAGHLLRDLTEVNT